MRKSKLKVDKRFIGWLAALFNFNRSPIRALTAVFFLGVTAGIGYEEMFGIGTWHKFNSSTEHINVCFTPPSGCGSLIARELAKAKDSILMQAFGLTSASIINQLKSAKRRGLDVRVLLDGGAMSDNKEVYYDLKSAGIDVAFDKMPGIAHNKVIVIDRRKVITGSFNFTKSADIKNAENVLLIEDPRIARQYSLNWLSRANLSTKSAP